VIGSAYTGHVLKSGSVDSVSEKKSLTVVDWLTLGLLAVLAAAGAFKMRDRIRKGLDLGARMLSLA